MTAANDALAALVCRLVEVSLHAHVCMVCGQDLIRGEWFSQHAPPDECELIAAAAHIHGLTDARNELTEEQRRHERRIAS